MLSVETVESNLENCNNPEIERKVINKNVDKKSDFLRICDSLIAAPDILLLPNSWVSQVIDNQCSKCIIWTEYKEGYSRVCKRVILFPDMTLKVS